MTALRRATPFRARRRARRPDRVRPGAVDARRAATAGRWPRCWPAPSSRSRPTSPCTWPGSPSSCCGPCPWPRCRSRRRCPAGAQGPAVEARVSSDGRDVAWGRALRIRLQPPERAHPRPRLHRRRPRSRPRPRRSAGSRRRVRLAPTLGAYRAFHNAGAELLYVAGQFDRRGRPRCGCAWPCRWCRTRSPPRCSGWWRRPTSATG